MGCGGLVCVCARRGGGGGHFISICGKISRRQQRLKTHNYCCESGLYLQKGGSYKGGTEICGGGHRWWVWWVVWRALQSQFVITVY